MRKILDNVLLRLFVYYAVLLAAFLAVLDAFPWIGTAIARERARVGAAALRDSSDASLLVVSSVPATDAEVLVPIIMTLLGALGLALPVAFVYQWTREPEAYRRDFGRALIALPIAVALAVFLVKNSLALAFGLAGIVAAIRWRAGLRETMDGVFVFVVIGIGLAAGGQLLIVALVASVIFNLLILTLARTAYASRPRQLEGWTLTAPATAAPAAEPRRVVTVRIEATDRIRAEAHVESVLGLAAKQWEKLGVAPEAAGRVRLEYSAKLKKGATAESLESAILAAGLPEIAAVTTTLEG